MNGLRIRVQHTRGGPSTGLAISDGAETIAAARLAEGDLGELGLVTLGGGTQGEARFAILLQDACEPHFQT